MTTQSAAKPVQVLLVEDDPADAQMVREILEGEDLPSHVSTVEDGEKALAFLHREGKHAQAPRPDLILLDLKMPRMNGLEVLAKIKSDEKLRSIPVAILTTSDAPDDIVKAYALQAAMFITKPAELEEFTRVMSTLRELFLTIVKLPPRN